MKGLIKTFLLLSLIFLLNCERRRNCKNVNGLEFNENIIEVINTGDDYYCIFPEGIDNPIVILDTIELKKYFSSDPNYCKKEIRDFDFSQYSILTFATNFNCAGMSIRFDLIDEGNNEYLLNIYKCGRKRCLSKAKIGAHYIFKTRKLNSNIQYKIYE